MGVLIFTGDFKSAGTPTVRSVVIESDLYVIFVQSIAFMNMARRSSSTLFIAFSESVMFWN
jgi:hypothetical protein